ncbi:MAG TPA: hypothetical protein DEA61_04020, partial [Caldanaerobacter subterraneus]|nr:hypothetical protein [Caldanaerobacter subterraneus]
LSQDQTLHLILKNLPLLPSLAVHFSRSLKIIYQELFYNIKSFSCCQVLCCPYQFQTTKYNISCFFDTLKRDISPFSPFTQKYPSITPKFFRILNNTLFFVEYRKSKKINKKSPKRLLFYLFEN